MIHTLICQIFVYSPIILFHLINQLLQNDEYNLQLKKQFDTVFPEIIKKQEALYRTSLELFYGTFEEFESAHNARGDAITNRQCKIAVTFAPKTEAVQKSSENVFLNVKKLKRSQPTPFPTTLSTCGNKSVSNSSISSEPDVKSEDNNKHEDTNEEVFEDSKSSAESPTRRSTFEELHSQAVETRPSDDKDDPDDSFSEDSEEESAEESSVKFDLDELEDAEAAKTISQPKDEDDCIDEKMNDVEAVKETEENSSAKIEDKSATSQVEALLEKLKAGTSDNKSAGTPEKLIHRRFRVKFDFNSADVSSKFFCFLCILHFIIFHAISSICYLSTGKNF